LVVSEAVRRAGVDPAAIDEVILGAADQAGQDNRNVARMAALPAGLPTEVPMPSEVIREASDKSSDNGPRQRQTHSDVARHRYPSNLR
jgi:hypothetical protein